MINYSKITIKNKPNNTIVDEGLFYGLTFLQTNWGNINLPTIVKDKDELLDKFSDYSDPNSENDWMQCWNFLEYSKNLKIFRVAKQEPTETFTGTDLTSVAGSSHAFALLQNRSSTFPFITWDSTDKGSSIYFKLNDFKRSVNEPTFNNSDQVLDVYAKYAGSRGNDFKITFMSYLDDLTEWRVFQEYTKLTYTSPVGTYTIGNTITGVTSGATGTIKRVIVDGSTTHVWVDVLNVQFEVGEDDNLTNTIVTVTEPTSVSENPKISDIVDRKLNINEFVFVLTEDNDIILSDILSLDPNDTNFVENYENDWLTFFKNSNVAIASIDDSDSEKDDKMIGFWQEYSLTNGVSDSLEVYEIVEQLEKLKDKYKSNYDILFSETFDGEILTKLAEINTLRKDFLVVINQTEFIEYLEDENGDFLEDEYGQYLEDV